MDDGVSQDNSRWLQGERSEKVPQIVARRILKDINERGLLVGDTLPPEATMLADFGVGRASLREALRILETHGLIRIKAGPHGGPVVTAVSSVDFGRTTSLFLNRVGSNYQELLEARMIVEPIMARLAAERLTPESAARLSAAVEQGHRAAEASSEAWSVAMELFHRVVAEMSGNRILDMFGGALISIEARHVGPIYPRSHRQQALDVHERLADAILDRDADAADQLARDHINEVARLLKENYAAQLDHRIAWR